MDKNHSHGSAAAALVRSIASMELRDSEERSSSKLASSALPVLPHANGTFTDIIDSVKDLFSTASVSQTQHPRRILHNPKSVDNAGSDLKFQGHTEDIPEFLTLVQRPDVNVNEPNHQGETPLHSLVKKKFSKKESHMKLDLLLALLMYSDADVNLPNENGNTALHMAAEGCDLQTIKLLLVFGANINVLNLQKKTPLDLIEGPYHLFCRQDSTIRDVTIVDMVANPPGSVQSQMQTATFEFGSLPSTPDTPSHFSGKYTPLVRYPAGSGDYTDSLTNSAVSPGNSHVQKSGHPRHSLVYSEAQLELAQFFKKHGAARGKELTKKHSLLSKKEAVKPFFDAALTEKESILRKSPVVTEKLSFQVTGDRWTEHIPKLYYQLSAVIESKLSDVTFSIREDPDVGLALALQMKELKMLKEGGSRILFLDGGGMRGLIQIEILSQLEEQTGRRITELFDWIVGTSTGAVVALGLVYAKKTLKELRQLYYTLKEEVFGKSRLGMAYNTEALENILRSVFGDMRMDEVKYPRVLVSAVNKSTVCLKLHFFNNCFDDEFSTEDVWKVARYTSAAPMFFNECENYVDGGILANNPSANGLTKIQDFYRKQRQRLPISLVVSVGSGKLPEDELGRADAQDFLFFGKHWFRSLTAPLERFWNFKTLFINALVEAEHIADNIRSRCFEQGISYYRLSPQLNEVIAAGETDTAKLIGMVLLTKSNITTQPGFSSLVLRFHRCSEANRKMTRRYHRYSKPKLHRSPAFRRKVNVGSRPGFSTL